MYLELSVGLLAFVNLGLVLRIMWLDRKIDKARIYSMLILSGVENGSVEQIIYRKRRYSEMEIDDMNVHSSLDSLRVEEKESGEVK